MQLPMSTEHTSTGLFERADMEYGRSSLVMPSTGQLLNADALKAFSLSVYVATD